MDISLTSPGTAVYCTTTDTWKLYGFPQRKSEMNMHTVEGNVEISLFSSMIPSAASCNEERYEVIRSNIMNKIMNLYRDTEDVTVVFESYAFGAKHAGNSYKLQELGGVLKHAIYTTFPTWNMVVVTPGAWKKQSVGIGNATKKQVVDYIKTNGPCIDLLRVCSVSKPTFKDPNRIPCPVQDISDAICIVLSEMKHRTKKTERRTDI